MNESMHPGLYLSVNTSVQTARPPIDAVRTAFNRCSSAAFVTAPATCESCQPQLASVRAGLRDPVSRTSPYCKPTELESFPSDARSVVIRLFRYIFELHDSVASVGSPLDSPDLCQGSAQGS